MEFRSGKQNNAVCCDSDHVERLCKKCKALAYRTNVVAADGSIPPTNPGDVKPRATTAATQATFRATTHVEGRANQLGLSDVALRNTLDTLLRDIEPAYAGILEVFIQDGTVYYLTSPSDGLHRWERYFFVDQTGTVSLDPDPTEVIEGATYQPIDQPTEIIAMSTKRDKPDAPPDLGAAIRAARGINNGDGSRNCGCGGGMQPRSLSEGEHKQLIELIGCREVSDYLTRDELVALASADPRAYGELATYAMRVNANYVNARLSFKPAPNPAPPSMLLVAARHALERVSPTTTRTRTASSPPGRVEPEGAHVAAPAVPDIREFIAAHRATQRRASVQVR